MLFLVGVDTPVLGNRFIGYIEAESQSEAQRAVVEKLVAAGVPIYKIAQVTDCHTLEVYNSTISIVPIAKFGEKKAEALVALIK